MFQTNLLIFFSDVLAETRAGKSLPNVCLIIFLLFQRLQQGLAARSAPASVKGLSVLLSIFMGQSIQVHIFWVSSIFIGHDTLSHF